MPNRIQIVQWREIGDDEDCLDIETFPDGDNRSLVTLKAEEHELVEDGDCDVDPVMIVNYDADIVDGDIMESYGRKFRISITEVTDHA